MSGRAVGPRVSIELDATLVAAASAAAGEHGWDTDTQLEHWIRLGIELDRGASPAVWAVVRGEAQSKDLDAGEQALARALIDAAILTRAHEASFGAAARAEGQTTVFLDADGALVERGPDA